jgi:hypothetical protein
MAFNYSPKIVTDGLVLYLDAANPKSYPGSGTVWRDISRTGANGTLINGPTFDSGNGGSIVFDGVNDMVEIPNPINQLNLQQEWSVMSWINVTNKTLQILIDGINNDLWISYTNSDSSLLYLNGLPNDYYMYGNDLTDIGWVLVTFRFKNSTGDRTIYRNINNISTSGPNQTSTPSGILSTLRIGSGLQGKLANVLIYDRYITNNELIQNYNATKTRYQ